MSHIIHAPTLQLTDNIAEQVGDSESCWDGISFSSALDPSSTLLYLTLYTLKILDYFLFLWRCKFTWQKELVTSSNWSPACPAQSSDCSARAAWWWSVRWGEWTLLLPRHRPGWPHTPPSHRTSHLARNKCFSFTCNGSMLWCFVVS